MEDLSSSADVLEPEPAAAVNLRRGSSLRIPSTSSNEESELGLRRSGSLRIIPRRSDARDVAREQAHLTSARSSPSSTSSSSTSSSDRCADCSSSNRSFRPARRYAPAAVSDAPAPEYLARSLLQLGCPVVSMPTPRGGVGSEQPPSSDSDDSTIHQQHQGHAHSGQNVDSYTVPKVQVSGPPNIDESASIINGQKDGDLELEEFWNSRYESKGRRRKRVVRTNEKCMGEVHDSFRKPIMLCFVQGFYTKDDSKSRRTKRSAGSISARSAPSTPLQAAPDAPQTAGQQSISGSQLTVAGTSYPQPPRSPSHAALRCNDSHLSKPLSRSTPSMAAGGAQTPAKVSRSSSRSSPTSTSNARQKKFHRHFSQVAEDERVLNYYSCALVGDILLQGHLYITPNYFAFYSNVFGYVTKLLIPTTSVLKISKEKTARIIPNAVAVSTEEERHVFCSLLSRDSTYKLMKQVWDAAIEPQTTVVDGALSALASDVKLLTPDVVDDSEVNAEEDESSMSESGTDLTVASPIVCTDTDGAPVALNRPNLTPTRLETAVLAKQPLTSNKSSKLGSLFASRLKPGTVIAILVVLLAVLYVSAALMMMRIDKLHTAYLNHPLVSPERFTQDRLLHYLNTNLDQIVKVRQSLQTLSQQFVTMSQGGSETGPTAGGGVVEPEDAPS